MDHATLALKDYEAVAGQDADQAKKMIRIHYESLKSTFDLIQSSLQQNKKFEGFDNKTLISINKTIDNLMDTVEELKAISEAPSSTPRMQK